jgi:uncharacterized protein YjbI with pentapeptide repeats
MDRAEFNGADAEAAVMVRAAVPYADFSHANLHGADLSGADLTQARFHRIRGTNADFTGANLKLAEYTDQDLAEAEDWVTPEPPETESGE